MDDYIRLNWSVEGQEPGTLVFEDNANGRLEAAKLFVEQAATPGLRYVEGWRCWAEKAGAQRLWEFSPYFPAGTGGIAAQPPESEFDDAIPLAPTGGSRWTVRIATPDEDRVVICPSGLSALAHVFARIGRGPSPNLFELSRALDAVVMLNTERRAVLNASGVTYTISENQGTD